VELVTAAFDMTAVKDSISVDSEELPAMVVEAAEVVSSEAVVEAVALSSAVAKEAAASAVVCDGKLSTCFKGWAQNPITRSKANGRPESAGTLPTPSSWM
jgi:hypothetical protein